MVFHPPGCHLLSKQILIRFVVEGCPSFPCFFSWHNQPPSAVEMCPGMCQTQTIFNGCMNQAGLSSPETIAMVLTLRAHWNRVRKMLWSKSVNYAGRVGWLGGSSPSSVDIALSFGSIFQNRFSNKFGLAPTNDWLINLLKRIQCHSKSIHHWVTHIKHIQWLCLGINSDCMDAWKDSHFNSRGAE